MKKVIITIVLLSAVFCLPTVAQRFEDYEQVDRWGLNQAAGIGLGVNRFYNDMGMDTDGERMPLVVPEIEFQLFCGYVALGYWRRKVGSPFPGVDEKVSTSSWKIGPMFRYGRPGRCWTFAPYVGMIRSHRTYDDSKTAETLGGVERSSRRYMFGLRVGLTRRYFECALHASTRECGLSLTVKMDWDEKQW